MSPPDALVEAWAATYTDMLGDQIERLPAAVVMRGANARDAKLKLDEAIVRRCHGTAVAIRSRHAFLSTFSDRNAPEHMEMITVQARRQPLDLVRLARPDLSNNALRRRLIQRAIRVNGNVIVEDSRIAMEGGAVLRIGPRSSVLGPWSLLLGPIGALELRGSDAKAQSRTHRGAHQVAKRHVTHGTQCQGLQRSVAVAQRGEQQPR